MMFSTYSIVFLTLMAFPCLAERVIRNYPRGKVAYPRTGLLRDPRDPNRTITVYFETSQGRHIFDTDDEVNYFISKKDQSEPVKVDLANITSDGIEIYKDGEWYFGVHGWTGTYKDSPLSVPEIVAAIHSYGDANIILVDWEKGASNTFYPTAVKSAKKVGEKVADAINNLVKRGVAPKEKIRLVGFSLGGHVVGFIGKYLYSSYGWKPKKITSIDPAGPLYDDNPADERIDSKDGEYVEIIHTCGDKLGLWKPAGHVDIYVNTGRSMQPGCSVLDDVSGSCSHQFGKNLYGKYTDLRMKAYRCTSYSDFTKGRCDDDVKTPCEIGFKYPRCPEGVYHLDTRSLF